MPAPPCILLSLSEGNFMNVSAWSIRNPLVAVLLFALLALGGWHGFRAMRVQQFPDMDFPVVIVSVSLSGA